MGGCGNAGPHRHASKLTTLSPNVVAAGHEVDGRLSRWRLWSLSRKGRGWSRTGRLKQGEKLDNFNLGRLEACPRLLLNHADA